MKLIPEELEKQIHSLNILETMNECVWLGDKNHITVYVNPKFEEISGYKLAECIGKNCTYFFDKESKQKISEHHKLRISGESSQYEATLITKSNEKVPLLVSGAPTPKGGTIGIFTNLTQLKKLADKEKLSQEIIRHSNEAIVVVDPNLNVKLWNNGAKKIFGLIEKEALNKHIFDLTIETEESRISQEQIIEELETKGFVHNLEIIRERMDGGKLNLIMSLRKVMDEENTPMGYIIMYKDISLQKKSNNELQKRFDAMQEAYKELGLQRRQNDYINEIINSATSADSLESLEKLIVSAVCMLTKCDAAILRLYDEEKDSLILSQCLGVNSKWWDKHKLNYKNSLAEEATLRKKPIIINNIEKSDKHQGTNLIRLHEFKTLILIPLYIETKVIGSLSLYSTEVNKFRFIETDFLDKFGKQCAIAINAKLK